MWRILNPFHLPRANSFHLPRAEGPLYTSLGNAAGNVPHKIQLKPVLYFNEPQTRPQWVNEYLPAGVAEIRGGVSAGRSQRYY
jgi:hypothetical protein